MSVTLFYAHTPPQLQKWDFFLSGITHPLLTVQCLQAVLHLSTDQHRHCLTLAIEQELVPSV